MKTIVTLDLADQAYGFPQLDGSGNLQATGSLHGTASYAETTPKSYRVYTALLTQTGTSNPGSLSSREVTQGVTYLIDGADGTSDFSNVGGPPIGTGDGTYFVATNSNIPNDYGTANLLYNTGAPVATVLENTIGNIWWTYGSDGRYYINSDALFTGIVPLIVRPMGYQGGINLDDIWGSYYGIRKFNSSEIVLETGIPGSGRSNDQLFNQFIEIRVYN
jgi:hypothetical protein